MNKTFLTRTLVPIFSTIISTFGFAQYNYVSEDNNSQSPADWHDGSTWTIPNGPSSEATPVASWNNQVMHGQVGNISVYGYTKLNLNFNVGNGSPSIDVYDTLFVTGNLSLQQTRLTVHSNGLLIVDGDLTLENGTFDFNNDGTVVVTGNVSVTNGNIDNEDAFSNQNDFYVYGSTSVTNGGSFNSCFPGGGCDPNDDTKTETQLENENYDLYQFVSSGNVELPTKLLFFEGAVSSNSVLLDWATSEEENFDYFSIERSTDCFDFESIGKVFSSGKNTKVRQDYQFKDKAPLSGTSYYRLKAVDFDGTFEYFKAIYIDYSGNSINNFASVYPNPGNGDQLILKFDNTLNTPVSLKVYDLSGVVIFEESTSQASLNINFNNKVKSGLYLVSLEAGNKAETIKWLVR